MLWGCYHVTNKVAANPYECFQVCSSLVSNKVARNLIWVVQTRPLEAIKLWLVRPKKEESTKLLEFYHLGSMHVMLILGGLHSQTF